MTHKQQAKDLAQEWQDRLLSGECLMKSDHEEMLAKAITTAHAQGFAECREMAINLWLSPSSKSGHANFAEQIRALQPAAPGSEGEG